MENVKLEILGDRKPPPRQLISHNSHISSYSAVVKIPKNLDPDSYPDQHQNRM